MVTERTLQPRTLFEQSLPTIESLITAISRRRHLDANYAEDFYSHCMIKLLEDDCACLRKFRWESSLKTFLNTVLQRQFLDFQDHHLGRWRPSALAKREGPQAIELDRLMTRDGLTEDEALQVLLARDRDKVNEEKLRALASLLPRRRWRKRREVELTEDLPALEGTDSDLLCRERRKRLLEIYSELKDALNAVEAEDRQILQLRFLEGLQVSQIANRFQVEAKPLYRRIYRILLSLKKALRNRGITDSEVAELLGQSWTVNR